MYYFKTIPENFIKPKMSNSLLENTKTSPIHRWPFFPFLNNLKINRTISRKTNPLLLFVNLLMKHGKKTSALRVLSTTLYLFKARISKIKLEKKGKQKTVNYHKFKNFGFWRNTYKKAFITQYSIKPINFTGILSSTKAKKLAFREALYPSPFGQGASLLAQRASQARGKSKTSPSVIAAGLPLAPSGAFKSVLLKPKNESFFGVPALAQKASQASPLSKGTASQDQQAELGHAYSTLDKGSANNVHGEQPITPLKGISASISDDRTQYSFFPELYRQVFPFFYNFSFLQDFYTSKHFFRGFPFFKLKYYKIELDQKYIFRKAVLTNNEKHKHFAKTLVNCKPLVGTKKKDKKNDNFSWYKNFEKNPSWDFLTSPQKTTFLYCLYKAIANVKPPLECRTKRIGGSNKQIPGQISEHRQWGIAIRWIIEAAKNLSKKKSENSEKSYKPVAPSYHNNIQSSGMRNKSKYPKRDFFDKTMTSLLQRTLKGPSLKEQTSKTRCYRFCFFLADSLENAYYKRGPLMQKRNLWIEAALTHRAFLRYRWW